MASTGNRPSKGMRHHQNQSFTRDMNKNRTTGSITKGSIAVVEGNYTYIRFVESGDEELYDHRNDPDEVKNLVQALPEKADHLNKLLHNKFRMSGISD